jgi:transposase
MLSVAPTARVFLAVGPVDMRGSFDALAGHARTLGLDPLDGALYVFLSRRRRLVKVVHFDGSGWVILQKRLERGTFELPEVPDDVDRVRVDGAALAALLTGLKLDAPRRRWLRREASPKA